MPNQRAVPTLRRRRLGEALLAARKAIEPDLSQEKAALAMGWDESKLSRIENARARIKPAEVVKLLDVYGVTDQSVITALEGLAKDAGKQGWWQTFGDVVALGYKDYLTLESDAESTHIWAPQLIPGLLQTGSYAREIISATALTRTPEEVTALAEVRKARQSILTRPQNPLNLWAVLDSGILHKRSAAYPSMMREQIRHLLDMADLPNVTIQLMELEATPHPGLVGGFHVIRFPRPWPTVINLENLRGGYFVEGTADAKVFETAFERIVAAALSVDDSRQRLKKHLERNTE
ncbi:helix-turn-helix domain-containing protein [Streptomyces graminilatus]|uniref:helix-turn-helix domain-containing protein n=1 Tax=Streptomyces graminilatus TaxID=1464070 RepID=UPI0006E1E6A3|nr:helix-turn-helix transcriptional regulator [Streptomyces graminilatus]